jgi:SAM-dependent methyltransferase
MATIDPLGLWKRLPTSLKEPARRGWFELVSRIDRRGEVRFLNHGCAMPGAALDLDAADVPDRFAVQLYHRVASPVSWKGRDALEVSCGRGGGAWYAWRSFGPRSLVGLDRTAAAVRFCERAYTAQGLSFRRGDALALPFPVRWVDVVVNVEASLLYEDLGRFLAEVRRVLRPGGHLLFADYRKAAKLPALRAALAASGLEPIEEQDLSDDVAAALRLDRERRRALVDRMLPRVLRGLGHRFAGIEDDDAEARRFASRAKVYLRAVLRRGGEQP